MLKGADGSTSKITVSCKYIPVKMQLDPSESINNMGTLRVDVMGAEELPAADRNGFSDPYCKFYLNGKDVFKSNIQKKTLNPSWNESFETPINSRTAAKFHVKVMDWDRGDKDDLLGEADINLELLEPFKPKQVVLGLDGKSGALRLKMLFKPDYVVRSRQGSSTFSGTFAAPVKIVGAPVKGVGAVGGAVGGGVVKGASFLRHGFKGKKESRDVSNGFVEPEEREEHPNGDFVEKPLMENPLVAPPVIEGPSSTPQNPPHARTKSFGAASVASAAGGSPGKPEAGTAMFTMIAASGYPAGSKLQVHVKQCSSKGAKEVYKTKPVKSSTGEAKWDAETFRVSCSPDTQFQIQVKNDKMIGSEDLGEALFFIDDTSIGSEKMVKVGGGNVTLRTTFAHAEESFKDSPRALQRKSFLSRRDVSRGTTPT